MTERKTRPFWGGWYMRHLQPLHNRGRLCAFCWDCRLLRKARREGDFYDHDDPLWYVRELFARRRAGVTSPPPAGTRATGSGQNWAWTMEHGARRLS